MNYLTDSAAGICLRMRQLREQAHLTQEKLADELGVSVNYLGEVERGRKALSHSLAHRFCSYFHISYDYLYRGVPSTGWNLLSAGEEFLTSPSSWCGVRDQPNYMLSRDIFLSQLESCSAQEFQVISRLAYTYLYTSRQQQEDGPVPPAGSQENTDGKKTADGRKHLPPSEPEPCGGQGNNRSAPEQADNETA